MNRQNKSQGKRQSKGKKRGLKRKRVYADRGDYRTVNTGRQVADRVTATYVYAELPANRFTTAANVGSINYHANSMYEIFVGAGSQAVIPYYNIMRLMYKSYRVLRSTIKVVVTSRESVNGMELLLVPMDDTAVPSITTTAEYVNAASLKYAKRVMVPPYVGGRSNVTLRSSIDLSKFNGPEYLTSSEWSGATAASANPTQVVYWLVAYYNQNTNTVTTGGLNVQVTVTNFIELFDPDRSESVALAHINKDNPNQYLTRSQQIAVEMEALSKELSALKQ